MTPRRSLHALALFVVVLLALAPAADAAKPFRVPGCLAGDLAPAASEGVLVRLCEDPESNSTGVGLGTLLPSGQITRRTVPENAEGPFAAGPAGEVWGVAGAGQGGLELDRIAADGTVTRFPLGTPQERNTLEVYGLVPDGEGAVWVADGELAPELYGHPYDSLGGELMHVAADGTVVRFPVPEHVEPHGLVRGPDGNLWFTGESRRAASEHVTYLGKGYVGRMTPTGEFALFPTATEQSAPGGIAVGSDGRLWFAETSNRVREVATIGTNGTFGPSLKVRDGYLLGPLAIGPEGDAWLPIFGAMMRITSQGQQTVFPAREIQGVVVGAEGDIWTRQAKGVERIVPGAPGIDTWKIEADRSSKTIRVQLACGGSEGGCEGTLDLSLPEGRGTKPGVRLARAHYSVPAESQRELPLSLPAKAFALAHRLRPKRAGSHYVAPVVVHATVAGGPTLERRIQVPGLAGPAVA